MGRWRQTIYYKMKVISVNSDYNFIFFLVCKGNSGVTMIIALRFHNLIFNRNILINNE